MSIVPLLSRGGLSYEIENAPLELFANTLCPLYLVKRLVSDPVPRIGHCSSPLLPRGNINKQL